MQIHSNDASPADWQKHSQGMNTFLLDLNQGSSLPSDFHSPPLARFFSQTERDVSSVIDWSPPTPDPPSFSTSNPLDCRGWPRIKATSTLPYGRDAGRSDFDRCVPHVGLMVDGHLEFSGYTYSRFSISSPEITTPVMLSLKKKKGERKRKQTYAFEMCTHDSAKTKLPKIGRIEFSIFSFFPFFFLKFIHTRCRNSPRTVHRAWKQIEQVIQAIPTESVECSAAVTAAAAPNCITFSL